ncbi:TPA: single-stranded DNA-binding protein, partial [Salmonella enterica subsp. enterica serovar Onderstepoort]
DLVINEFEFERKDKKTGEILFDSNGEPKKGLMFSQKVLARLGRQAIEIKIPLEQGQPAYPVGQYLIHPSTFKVGQYGDLNVGRDFILFPLTEVKK